MTSLLMRMKLLSVRCFRPPISRNHSLSCKVCSFFMQIKGDIMMYIVETTASAKEFDDSEEFMMGDFSQSILCQVDQMSQSLKPSSSVHQKPISRNVPCLPQESPLKRKNSGISDQAFKTPLAPQSRPIMSGFSSARGSSLPSISKEARDKAASLLGDVLSSHDPALKNSTDSQVIYYEHVNEALSL